LINTNAMISLLSILTYLINLNPGTGRFQPMISDSGVRSIPVCDPSAPGGSIPTETKNEK
jgi:hypothetical protein